MCARVHVEGWTSAPGNPCTPSPSPSPSVRSLCSPAWLGTRRLPPPTPEGSDLCFRCPRLGLPGNKGSRPPHPPDCWRGGRPLWTLLPPSCQKLTPHPQEQTAGHQGRRSLTRESSCLGLKTQDRPGQSMARRRGKTRALARGARRGPP